MYDLNNIMITFFGRGIIIMKKETFLSEFARNNKMVMNAHFVVTLVMVLFCILQAAGGLSSWGYALFALLLGMTPVVLDYAFYRKDKETTMIKHFAGIGFAIFYTFSLFTSTTFVVFLFVIPMLLVVMVYNDTKYSLLLNIGVVIECILTIVIDSKTGQFHYGTSDSAVVQVVSVILIAIYNILTAHTLHKNSSQKLQVLSEEQKKSEDALKRISNVSNQTENRISAVYEDLEKLNASSLETYQTMEELSMGASETADAVQSQLSQTETIQEKLQSVTSATSQITENMKHTLQVLENGNSDVKTLVEQVEISVQNGADVTEKLTTLEQYIEEMHSIVGLIGGIAKQVSLLALNASIEAARAGEAGRGFSVVASEISKMATQTQDATSNITDLINNIAASIKESVEVIYQMIEGINEEKKSSLNTRESFKQIQDNTLSIRDNIEHLANGIYEVKEINDEIAHSVEKVSEISEKVSIHSDKTMESQKSNDAILGGISDKMQELMNLLNQ